jgi:single-stranded DNA-binding protein
MQVFGNVATQPERKKSKTTGKDFFEFRLAESQRGVDTTPTWYTCRVIRETDPELGKGDFVKVTGKLKADFYLSREGKPTGTLLIIAFEAAKIAKPQPAASTPTKSTTHIGTQKPEVKTAPLDWMD